MMCQVTPTEWASHNRMYPKVIVEAYNFQLSFLCHLILLTCKNDWEELLKNNFIVLNANGSAKEKGLQNQYKGAHPQIHPAHSYK